MNDVFDDDLIGEIAHMSSECLPCGDGLIIWVFRDGSYIVSYDREARCNLLLRLDAPMTETEVHDALDYAQTLANDKYVDVHLGYTVG